MRRVDTGLVGPHEHCWCRNGTGSVSCCQCGLTYYEPMTVATGTSYVWVWSWYA